MLVAKKTCAFQIHFTLVCFCTSSQTIITLKIHYHTCLFSRWGSQYARGEPVIRAAAVTRSDAADVQAASPRMEALIDRLKSMVSLASDESVLVSGACCTWDFTKEYSALLSRVLKLRCVGFILEGDFDLFLCNCCKVSTISYVDHRI